ncbi:MAG: Ni,Fe-hydrogenase III large subunit [Candidatus Thermoplasmatota archaeon]|nr:Ni,Fe-hydrogenase III large subunit [Candidatus Thermoplasmatota archaeon]
MQYYKTTRGGGRYIGQTRNFTVYSDSIVPPIRVEKKPSEILPGELIFNYGPSTGGLIESVRIALPTPGEMIRSVAVDPAYKLRKLKLTGLSLFDAFMRVERINGYHSSSYQAAFIKAAEDALLIGDNRGIDDGLVLQMELERIRSHLNVLERLCEPAGFGVPYHQLAQMREEVARLISSIYGHRYFFGVHASLQSSPKISPGLTATANGLKKRFALLFESLQSSKIFVNRLQGTGKIEKPWLVGPVARAAGYRHDARTDSPSLNYEGYGFDPVVEDGKDAFARFLVRGNEILSSFAIVDQVISNGKPESAGLKDMHGTGIGASRVESPQGDLFCYLTLKDGMVENIEFCSPSISNIIAFELSMQGNIFTDFHFNWESFGIWISEAGVEIE